MKLVREEILINEGGFSKTDEYRKLHDEIEAAIKAVVWPDGSDKFSIYPATKTERHPNGVLPIKHRFVDALVSYGWKTEEPLDIAVHLRPGPLDLVKPIEGKYYAVEWETGNVSSSHRALNKMAIGIGAGLLLGGTLVVPGRNLYKHLTDRIGNYEELMPYFPMYQIMKPASGILTVMVVEYDEISPHVPRIPKGTDGYGLGTGDTHELRPKGKKRRKGSDEKDRLL